MDAQLLVLSEPRHCDHAVEWQESIGTHAHAVFAGLEFDRTEGRRADAALVDGDDRFGRRIRRDGHETR